MEINEQKVSGQRRVMPRWGGGGAMWTSSANLWGLSQGEQEGQGNKTQAQSTHTVIDSGNATSGEQDAAVLPTGWMSRGAETRATRGIRGQGVGSDG